MIKPKNNESKQDFLKRCTSDAMQKDNKSSKEAYAMCNLQWDNSKGQRAAMTLSAPLEFQGGEDDKPRTFMITAKTNKAVQRWGSKLVIAINGIHTKARIPVLREHQRDRVVGHSEKVWNDTKNLYVTGPFSKSTQDAVEVLALADEGYPWQASVRIEAKKVMYLEKDSKPVTVNGEQVTGPADIWLESVVTEVSFVSLGADDETAAIAMSDQKLPVDILYGEPINHGGRTMNQQELETSLASLMAEKDVNLIEALAKYDFMPKASIPESQGLSQEEVDKLVKEATARGETDTLARITGIMDLCKVAEMPELAGTLIKENLSVEAAQKKILEIKAEQSSTNQIVSTISGLSAGNANALLADAESRAAKTQGA